MNKKSILILCLTSTFLLPMNVSAYELDESDNSIESVEYQSSDEENFSNQTSVFAQIGSSYKVTIPKLVVLSGLTQSASYGVRVDGDIAGDEVIVVSPDDYFYLRQAGKADARADRGA